MSVIDQLQLTRRAFIGRLGALCGLVLVPLQQWWGAERGRTGIVLRMLPVPGVRYSRAARNHMRYRLFLSREAIIAGLPHRGLIFTVEELPVTLSQQDLQKVFGTRRSLDRRRAADRRAYEAVWVAAENKSGFPESA